MYGLATISTIVMARLLTPADFGVVAIGLTVFAIAESVTNLSLAQALIHMEAPDERHINCSWTLNVLRGLLVGAFIAALGAPVADFYGDDRLKLIMALIGASAFIGSLANTRLAMFERDLVFRQKFVVQTTGKLVLVLVSLAVAWQTRSYLALVVGAIAAQLAQVIVSFAVAPHLPKPRLKEAGSLLSFSWWLMIIEIVRTINFRIEPLLIGKFVTIHTLGLFTVSRNFANLTTRETTLPLSATLFPAFRQLRDQPERQRKAYTRAQTLISAVAMPSGLLMAILAEPIVLLALGERWAGAVPLIQVLAVVFATETLGAALQPLAMANGRVDLVFRRSLQALTTRVPLTIAGLALGGLQGYLITRAMFALPGILFNKLIVRQIIGIPVLRQLLDNWRTLTATIAMAALGFGLTQMIGFGPGLVGLVAQIVLIGTVCVLAYLGILLGLWALCQMPEGPENDIVDAFNSILRKARQVIGIQGK